MTSATAIRARALPGLVLLASLCACTDLPDGVDAVSGFQLDRYLGTWYEIARLDHRFERGLSHVTATYERRADGGVSVLNRGYDDARNGWDQATGKAYFIGDATEGRLKVSFFGPFYGAYNIIELDEDYRYALVAGPSRGYLWILARTPALDEATLDLLTQRAERLGFPVDELIHVEHGRVPDPG